MSGALTSAMAMFGERAEGAERDRARFGRAQRLDDEIDAVLGLQRHLRIRQLNAVEAGAAVDVLGGDELPRHRPDAAGKNRHVGAAGKLDDPPRVPLGVSERHVAGDRDDAEHVESRRARPAPAGWRPRRPARDRCR